MAPRSTKGRAAEPNLTREQILEEAARQFLERGYEKTRMQDIAARFGVTHAALYYYFPRKSDLLAQLNYSALDTLIAGATEARDTATTPAECFRLQLEAHIDFVVRHLALSACFVHFDKAIERADMRRIAALRRQYTELLTASFAEAQAAGTVTGDVEPRIAVNTLLGAANWMYRWLGEEAVGEPDELAARITAMLAGGFQRPAPRRRQSRTSS